MKKCSLIIAKDLTIVVSVRHAERIVKLTLFTPFCGGNYMIKNHEESLCKAYTRKCTIFNPLPLAIFYWNCPQNGKIFIFHILLFWFHAQVEPFVLWLFKEKIDDVGVTNQKSILTCCTNYSAGRTITECASYSYLKPPFILRRQLQGPFFGG